MHALSEITSDNAFSDQEAAVLIETSRTTRTQDSLRGARRQMEHRKPPIVLWARALQSAVSQRCTLARRYSTSSANRVRTSETNVPSATPSRGCHKHCHLRFTLSSIRSLTSRKQTSRRFRRGSTPGGMALLLKNALGLIDGADLDRRCHAARVRVPPRAPRRQRGAAHSGLLQP